VADPLVDKVFRDRWVAAATSGPWLGRTHERWVGKRNPDPGGDRIPVVYVTTPPKGSPRKLASEFAHFPGLPDRARYNTTDIADVLVALACNQPTDDCEQHAVHIAR